MKTKVVTNKLKHKDTTIYDFALDKEVSAILGGWIINHKFKVENKNGRVIVIGEYDLNVWYSYNNNTKTDVFIKTINCEEMLRRRVSSSSQLEIKCVNTPSITNSKIIDGKINIAISKEYEMEVIDEVEIIEDKPKKIELLEIYKDTGSNCYIVDSETRRHLYFGTDECEQKIIEQQNEIAKAVNYLLEKSDNNE